MKVIVDTNFVLSCLKEKVRIFDYLEEEFSEILIPSKVLDELKRISSAGGPSERGNAEVAVQWISLGRARIVWGDGYVDKQIVNFVRDNREIVVATLDKDLKKILGKKVKFLIFRGKNKLVVE